MCTLNNFRAIRKSRSFALLRMTPRMDGPYLNFSHLLAPGATFFRRCAAGTWAVRLYVSTPRTGPHWLGILLLLWTGSVWARTVTDELGRTIVLGEHPHRVICLAPSLTDTVYALGHGTDVAGITDYTAYPVEAQTKPNVGTVIKPSLETIVSLKPDLVLMLITPGGYDNLRALERLHLPVFTVKAAGMEGAYRSILSVGEALNDEPAAQALVQGLRARERKVRQRMAGKPHPAVLFVLWPDPFMTAGRGAFITDLIEAAGAHSVTADSRQDWPQVSLESVVARQPKSFAPDSWGQRESGEAAEAARLVGAGCGTLSPGDLGG